MKRTRILALALAVIMMAAMLAACGGNDGPASTPGSTATRPPVQATPDTSITATTEGDVPDYMNEFGFPIAKEPTTYTAMLKRAEDEGPWDEVEMMVWLAELTNVHFDYDVYPNDDTYREALNLQFIANSYSEVLIPRGWAVRWQDEEDFAKEGYLVNLKPLIARWMPNARHFYQNFPGLLAGAHASDGGVYGFTTYYRNGVGGNPHNWYMESYFVNAAGWSDVPNTVYEMRDFMYDIKALLDSGDYDNPMDDMYVLGIQNQYGSTPHTNLMLHGYTGRLWSLSMPFAVTPDGKTVEFMPRHPGFFEAAEFFRDIYRDGLVNPDLFTAEGSAINANKAATKYAMFTSSASNLDINIIRDRFVPGNEERGYFGCTSIRPMTSQYNDTPRIGYETWGTINTMLITDKCTQPEVIARWADLWYNTYGDPKNPDIPHPLNFSRGFYGRDWEYFNNDAWWTFTRNRPKDNLTDPQDPSLTAKIDWNYAVTHIQVGWSHPAGAYECNAYAEGAPMFIAKQVTNVENQFPYVTIETEFPRLARWAADEVAAAATKMADLTSYLHQQWALFYSNQLELTRANWDNMLNELDRMGAAELLGIHQAILDRWNSGMEG